MAKLIGRNILELKLDSVIELTYFVVSSSCASNIPKSFDSRINRGNTSPVSARHVRGSKVAKMLAVHIVETEMRPLIIEACCCTREDAFPFEPRTQESEKVDSALVPVRCAAVKCATALTRSRDKALPHGRLYGRETVSPGDFSGGSLPRNTARCLNGPSPPSFDCMRLFTRL